MCRVHVCSAHSLLYRVNENRRPRLQWTQEDLTVGRTAAVGHLFLLSFIISSFLRLESNTSSSNLDFKAESPSMYYTSDYLSSTSPFGQLLLLCLFVLGVSPQRVIVFELKRSACLLRAKLSGKHLDQIPTQSF